MILRELIFLLILLSVNRRTGLACFFISRIKKWVSKLSLFLCNLDEGAVVASNYEVKFEDIKYSLYGNKLLVTRSYNDYVPMQSNDQYDLLDNNLKIIKEDIFKNRNVWDVDFCCGDSMFIAEHKSNQILIDDEGNIHREARLLQCSSDGSTLLIGNFKENTRTLYDVTVEQNGTITAIFEALNVQLSATGQKLILQREDGQCVLYDLVSYEQKNISSVVSNRFYAITFNATGKIALLYNRDGSYLVDLDTLHVIEFCRSDFNIEFILGGEYIKYSDLDWGRYVIAVKDLFNNVNKETGIFQISSFLENKDLISLGWKDEPSSDLVHAINDQCDLHNNIEDLIKAFNLNGIKKEIFSKNNKTVFLFDDSRYLVSRCSDSLTIEQLALKKLIEKKLVDEDYINDNEAVKNVYDLFPDGPKRYLLELLKLQK